MKVCYNMSFSPPKHSKDLDLSVETDLDLWDCFDGGKLCLITEEMEYSIDVVLWDCFGREKLSYTQRNRILV